MIQSHKKIRCSRELAIRTAHEYHKKGAHYFILRLCVFVIIFFFKIYYLVLCASKCCDTCFII